MPLEQGTGQIPESSGATWESERGGENSETCHQRKDGANFLCQKSPIITQRVSEVKYHNKWHKFRSCYGLGDISTTSFIISLCMRPDGKATGVDNTQAQVATRCSHFCAVLVRLAAVHELH